MLLSQLLKSSPMRKIIFLTSCSVFLLADHATDLGLTLETYNLMMSYSGLICGTLVAVSSFIAIRP